MMKKNKPINMATGGLMNMPPFIKKAEEEKEKGITPYDVNTPKEARQGLPTRLLSPSRTRFEVGGNLDKDGSGDTTDFSKTVTYTKARQATPNIEVAVSPAAQTIAADSKGSGSSSPDDLTITAFEGGTDRFTSLGSPTFTNGLTGTVSSNTITFTSNASSMSADTGRVTIPVNFQDGDGTSGQKTVVASVTRVKSAAPVIVVNASPGTQTIQANAIGSGSVKPDPITITAFEGTANSFTSMVASGSNGMTGSISSNVFTYTTDATSKTDGQTDKEGAIGGFTTNNNFFYTAPEMVEGLGVNVSYTPSGTGRPDGTTSFALAYTGVEGLTVGYAEEDNGKAGTAKIDANTMYAKYAFGSFTVGVQSSEADGGLAADDDEFSAHGITYQVNDDLTIGYHASEYQFGDQTGDQESKSVQAAYTMGGMTLKAQSVSMDNVGGSTAARDDIDGYKFSVSFAF